jgi:hypothetical protein
MDAATATDPMEGLKPGRIVYYVFSQQTADEVNRRRTTSNSIAERMETEIEPVFGDRLPAWPVGAQAHIGNPVSPGDIYPAMVVRVFEEAAFSRSINLKVLLDGSDDFWAVSVPYDEAKRPATWHWMFEGQNTRYQPDRVEKSNA